MAALSFSPEDENSFGRQEARISPAPYPSVGGVHFARQAEGHFDRKTCTLETGVKFIEPDTIRLAARRSHHPPNCFREF